jgi:hypothetical protein
MQARVMGPTLSSKKPTCEQQQQQGAAGGSKGCCGRLQLEAVRVHQLLEQTVTLPLAHVMSVMPPFTQCVVNHQQP